MKRIDAVYHVRGEAEFVDDAPRPAEMLYAAVFASPVAHGAILSLDTAAALALEGVAAVYTVADIPGQTLWGSIIADQPLLAKDEVTYVGQPIAVVVGKTAAIARQAVNRISLQVEERPPVLDPRQAFERGHIIGSPRTFVLGDVDQAWEQCDLILEGTCDIGGQEHLYLETQRARVIPQEGQALRVYSATQNPYAAQRTIAQMLGLPNHAIEVDVKRLGGGFGGKEEQATLWACLAALAAWRTHQPVELVLSRQEDLWMTGKRHPYISDFKIGVTQEGKILVYEVKHYQNAGAYADLSTAVLERSLFHSANAYFIPNVRISGASCRTNLPPNTALRGFGGPQAMFVMESAIAQVAEALGRPRGEIQSQNLLQLGDAFPYGQRLQTDGVRQTWREAEHIYRLAEIRDRIAQYNASHFETKQGYAVMPVCFGISFTATFMNQASALVHVYTDGSVSVTTGGVEMGQGLSTKIANLAVKAFGIGEQRIKIESTNTTRIANMSPTAASVTTDLNGQAMLLAIEQILARLKSVAAAQLGVDDPDRIAIINEQILYDGQPTDWTWDRLVATAFLTRTNLSAHAFYATPGIGFDRTKEKGTPFAYHVCGAAIVEVTLDCLRGTYKIDAVKIVHDLGRSVNPLVDRGQVEGGLAQGLGWMTIEDLQFNEKGRLLSKDLSTYKAPDVFFMPDEIAIQFLEDMENTTGPYGSKAVGEPPLMYGIGIFFALRQAMRAFKPQGEFAFASPLTPERVLCELYADELKEIAESIS
ncbi:MAG: molybdopterin-dependent oxidoreductase [Leptolyngbyaceae cyanobacterium MO_188.B28]|nr:molybdopterin-dependent oxidoreductase [Leptolyngbyaceae cyanobacterium MO_188.B28]